MFGYLVAASDVLEEEQLRRYRRCYCGLCRRLGKNFSAAAKLTLNYDMTFLVLLLSSMYEPEEQEGESCCVRHPFEAQGWVTNEISDYAAAMNVAMGFLKCMDDWRDERRLSSLAEAQALKSSYEKVRAMYPRQCAAIDAALGRLSALELEKREAPDEAADCFGALMEELFVYKEDRWAAVLRALAHALGRFIYLMDAVMDLDEDMASGNYNPFKSFHGLADNESRFRDILMMQLGECVFYFDKLPLVQDVGLMQNILCIGLWAQFNQKYSRKDS